MNNSMPQPKYDAIATECQKIRTFLDQSPGFLKMWGSGYSFSVPAYLPHVPEDSMISPQEIRSHPDIIQLQHWCQQAGFHWALIETYDDCGACAMAADEAVDEEPHAMHLPTKKQFTFRVAWGDHFGQDWTVVCEGQAEGFPILEDAYQLVTSTRACLTPFLTWPTLTPLERQLVHEAHTAFLRLPARTPGLYASVTISLRSMRAYDELTRYWEITISDIEVDLIRTCVYQYGLTDQDKHYVQADLVFRFAADGTHHFEGDPWQWIADMVEVQQIADLVEVQQAMPHLEVDLESYTPPSPPSEREE